MDYNDSTSTSLDGITSKETEVQDLHIEYWEQILAAVVVSIISITGITGNSMIVVAVALSRKLQTSTNAFVASLSVADLLTSIFMIWYVVGLLGPEGWPLPRAHWLCSLTGFMIFTCTGASLYHLAAIAFNRLILITQPRLYKKLFTSWKLCCLVALPWLIPVVSCASLLASGIGGFGYDVYTCSDLDSHKNADKFNLSQTIIGLPIPLLTIIVSYTLIYSHLRKHFHKQRTMVSLPLESSDLVESTTKVTTSVSETTNAPIVNSPLSGKMAPSTRRTDRISKQQVAITKNLFLVVCAFFACFLLFFIGNVIPNSGHFLFYATLPSLANSTVNFLIYSRRHPHFRVVLRCMIKCSYHNIPEPSRLLISILSKRE